MKQNGTNAALALVLLASLGACASSTPPPGKKPRPPVSTPAPAPAEDDLGSHHRAITTASKDAQHHFDRGLTYIYAFDHDDAVTEFRAALAADPDCAMAWWGIALANGPHINKPSMDEAHVKAAWAAVENAWHLASGHANETERALIGALWRRYSKDFTTDRRGFDQAYAEAMRDVRAAHADDPDVTVLYAEALMDLHPWDLWTADGKPRSDDTTELVAALEAALALQPLNPGANHYYIHAMEGSSEPHKADAAADRLRTLVPDAGHLVHMPAHIDARVGRWAEASDTNVRAIAADERHAVHVPKAGFYRLYMAHDRHFLAYSAMMEGRFAVAIEAARAMRERFPRELTETLAPLIDGYSPIDLHVLVRFGRWEDVLEEPEPAAQLLVSRAVWHYARGVSLAALGRLDEAEAEAKALDESVATMDERRIGLNPAKAVLPIAVEVLAGEIAFRRGKTDEALALLREAVAVQDGLGYDEPPGWMQPVRHVLAATLLAAKKPAEAEKVLDEDLVRNPENGWALTGLVKCLEARGASDEAAMAKARLAKAWARADVKATSPCLCQPGN